jgi:predicted amidohydrolase
MWVAAVQLNSTVDMAANVARARGFIEAAARHGAQLVALPEHFACLGAEAAIQAAAQSLDGPLVTEFRSLAATWGIFLLLGSFPELPAAGPPPYNTSVLIGPDGAILAAYRKMHLFDIDLPGKPPYRESHFTRPGDGPAAAPLPGTPWVAGLSICYDLRFPELFRALTDQGANLLMTPAAFTATTGRDHWEVLLRARAVENQAYVIAPAQWGQHAPGRHSYGRALIIDPWGLILAQAPDGEGLIFAELAPARLAEVRRNMPCLKHRRIGVSY